MTRVQTCALPICPSPTPLPLACGASCRGDDPGACGTGYCHVGTPDGFGVCRNRSCPDSLSCQCPLPPTVTQIPSPTPPPPTTAVCTDDSCFYPCKAHDGGKELGGAEACGQQASCQWCPSLNRCLIKGTMNKNINNSCQPVAVETCP